MFLFLVLDFYSLKTPSYLHIQFAIISIEVVALTQKVNILVYGIALNGREAESLNLELTSAQLSKTNLET
jgi:hypothetical protein